MPRAAVYDGYDGSWCCGPPCLQSKFSWASLSMAPWWPACFVNAVAICVFAAQLALALTLHWLHSRAKAALCCPSPFKLGIFEVYKQLKQLGRVKACTPTWPLYGTITRHFHPRRDVRCSANATMINQCSQPAPAACVVVLRGPGALAGPEPCLHSSALAPQL